MTTSVTKLHTDSAETIVIVTISFGFAFDSMHSEPDANMLCVRHTRPLWNNATVAIVPKITPASTSDGYFAPDSTQVKQPMAVAHQQIIENVAPVAYMATVAADATKHESPHGIPPSDGVTSKLPRISIPQDSARQIGLGR